MDLLPPNATPQERALSETAERVASVPVTVRELWSAQACPAAILPWLAWALSVDDWQPTWSEAEKRGAILQAVEIHRRKGTVGAVKRAFQALGYEVLINEDTGTPYTFRVVLDVSKDGIQDGSFFDRAEKTANAYKNARSHLEGIDALLVSNGGFEPYAVTISGESTKVFNV